MKKLNTGYLYVMIASVMFASIAIFGKMVINTGYGPIQMMIWQYTFIIITIFAVILIKNPKDFKIKKKEVLYMAVHGVISSAATNAFFYFSLQYIKAGMASMLIFTSPIFVVLFFIITGIRKINGTIIIALIFSIFGSAMALNIFTSSGDNVSYFGIFLGLMSGVCYAFFNVFADIKLKEMKPNIITFYSNIFALITAIILGLIFEIKDFSITLNIVPYILVLALFAGILPVNFIYKALLKIGSEKVSIIATMELPATLIFAYLILGEKMSFIQIAGVVLIIFATYVLQRGERQQLKQLNILNI